MESILAEIGAQRGVARPESEALLTWLDLDSATLVSSDLLEAELRRLAIREGLDQADVTALLDGVSLAALYRAVFRNAGLLPMPYLQTLDALHLEAAIRLDADAVLTYDRRLGEAARRRRTRRHRSRNDSPSPRMTLRREALRSAAERPRCRSAATRRAPADAVTTRA